MTTPPVTIAADDAIELGEMLEFLHDWIDYAPDALEEWLTRYTGAGYTLTELRADLARFAFLLGGDPGRLFKGTVQ